MYVLILLHYDNWLSSGAHYQHKVKQHDASNHDDDDEQGQSAAGRQQHDAPNDDDDDGFVERSIFYPAC